MEAMKNLQLRKIDLKFLVIVQAMPFGSDSL
jgi:hypothetical protein